jgi:hypothetical protein
VYSNISPGNDLSPLSLAVSTWLGRGSFIPGRFNTGSNSCSNDSPSDSLPKQTSQECLSQPSDDLGINSSSDYLPISFLIEKFTQQ